MPGRIHIFLKLTILFASFWFLSTQTLIAQCTDGTQPECACETAPVLCTVDELDGYVFSMTSYMHPWDGPSPICSSSPTSQTNNPTWFAFTAWCSNLTLRARPRNCHWNQGAVGVQIAIYDDCTFQHEVACDIDVQDCNTGTKVLNMTGLTIGGVYYFLIDGCLGSYCDVTIDVVGNCGSEEIAPWTMPVTGDTDPCVGSPVTYTVENLDGAAIYHWFLDGVLIQQSAATSFDTVWTTPGTYQLCIDASHEPCVPITDAPAQTCITINATEANAGVLNVAPTTLCINGTTTITSAGYTSGVDNSQIILITDASGMIVDVIPAASGTFTSGLIGTYYVYALNYITAAGTIPAIGSSISDIDGGIACFDLDIYNQPITFQTLSSTVSNNLCDNNGTDNDASDDTFTFDVLVTGPAAGTAWRSSDGTLQGVYGISRSCGPYLISAGSVYFDLLDADIPMCSTSITVDPPAVCSVCNQSIDAGQGSIIDCINTTATLTGTSSGAGSYHWTGPGMFAASTLTTTVIDSGWYYLTADFANQCTFTDSVFIAIYKDTPVADAGPDQVIDCNQTDVYLDGSRSTGNNLQFEWSDQNGAVLSTQPGLRVSTAGRYTLQVSNTQTGCDSTDHVLVMINPNIPGEVMAEVAPENCIGENNGVIEITAVTGGIPPYTYSLNGMMAGTSGRFTDLPPGDYALQITDGMGCTLDTSFTIEPGIDLQLTMPAIIELIVGHKGLIEASVNVPASALSSIQWSPGGVLTCDTCLITSITGTSSYSFLLTVTHQRGCVATAELDINVVPETEIYIPNIFSPNGDGLNDYFTVYTNQRVSIINALRVFDRWGNLVFERQLFYPNDESKGWDGTFRGKQLLPSVYTYYAEVLMVDGRTEVLKGDVTVVR